MIFTNSKPKKEKPGKERTFIYCLLLIFIFISRLNSSVGENVWTPIGPYGGGVQTVAVAPSNPEIVYAGSNGWELYRSDRGGLNGELVHYGVFTKDRIVVDPSDPYAVYVSGFKSTDGGTTFSSLIAVVVAVDPEKDSILYGLMLEYVVKSYDYGQSWDTLDVPPGNVAIAPSDHEIVYVGAGIDTTGFYRSVDAGTSWVRVGEMPAMLIDLKVSSDESSVLYAAFRYNGVYKSTDNGQSWHSMNNGLPSPKANCLAIDNHNPNIIYVSLGTYLWYEGGIYKSVNAGTTWVSVSDEVLEGKSVGNFAISPLDPEVIYVSTGVGVLKTINGGQSWQRMEMSRPPVHSIAVNPTNSSEIFIATPTLGVFKTTDKGSTWKRVNIPMPSSDYGEQWIYTVAFDPADPINIYAGGQDCGLFKSTDGGDTWVLTSLTTDFETYVSAIAIHPDNSNIIYCGTVGYYLGELYKSTNGGKDWEWLDLSGHHIDIMDIAIDPINPNVLYVSNGQHGLFKSENAGSTWVRASDGLLQWDTDRYHYVNSIVIDPQSTNILFATQGTGEGGVGGVFKSVDGGMHWTKVYEIEHVGLKGLILDPIDPERVYAAGTEGIFLSTDGGVNWEAITDGYPYHADIVVVDPQDPRQIYCAAIYGGGVWSYTDTQTKVDPELDLSHDEKPVSFSLFQNYPNPFNPITTIRYTIPSTEQRVQSNEQRAESVEMGVSSSPFNLRPTLKIYNILGQEVRTLMNEPQEPGYYSVTWDGRDEKRDEVSSGVYFYRLMVGDYIATRRMVLMK